MAATPPHEDGEDVMVVVSHIVEQMHDVIATLNEDIDRLVAERDRMKAAVLTLTSDAPTAPIEPRPRPSERVLNPKPKPNKARKQRSAATMLTNEHYAEVARVHNEAVVSGRSAIKALVDHFGLPETTVKNWQAVCRKRGLIIGAPKAAGRPPAAEVAKTQWQPGMAAALDPPVVNSDE